MTKLIEQPFAYQGDTTEPPMTDPNGYVNFTQGYTSDYEIDLTSSNPRAKPVERGIQNYLFNILTGNVQFWQQHDAPEWFANMLGGYPLNAVVSRQDTTGTWRPYRSLVAANLSDPLTNTTQWSYIKNPVEALMDIPMPSGGVGGPASEVIIAAIDFNSTTLTNGTFEVLNDTIAAACANLPSAVGGTKRAGILEDKRWGTVGAADRTGVQRYLNTNSEMFVRYLKGTTWSAWQQVGGASFLQTAGMRDYTVSSTIGADGIGYIHRFTGTATGQTITLQARSNVATIQMMWVVNLSTQDITVKASGSDVIRFGQSTAANFTLPSGATALISSTSAATQWELVGGTIAAYHANFAMHFATVDGGLNVIGSNVDVLNGAVIVRNSSGQVANHFADGNIQGPRWAYSGNPNNYLGTYIDSKVTDLQNYCNGTFVRDIRWSTEGEVQGPNFAAWGSGGRITTAPAGSVITNMADANSSGDVYLHDIDMVRYRFLQKNINGNWLTAGTA